VRTKPDPAACRKVSVKHKATNSSETSFAGNSF
jgi:hypothetical protein